MMKTKTFKTAAVCLLAAVFFLAFFLWLRSTAIKRPPRWVLFQERTYPLSDPALTITLQDQKITIVDPQEKTLYQTEEGIFVQEALVTELDQYPGPELILLVWKEGNYGEHRPFWVTENDDRLEQHIFIYSLDEAGPHPIWMSSTVSTSITGISLKENGLLVSFTDSTSSLWDWVSWGLTLIQNYDANGDPMEAPFSEDPSEISSALPGQSPGDNAVTVLALGDLILHQPLVDYGLRHDGYDFLFDPMRKVIASYDLSLLNQETPLTQNLEEYSDYPLFATPSKVVPAIQRAGFDLVTLATNHMLDQGEAGIETTLQAFREQGIIPLGIQMPGEEDTPSYTLLEVKGITFAFMNYTYGTNGQPLPKENPQAVHLLEDPDSIEQEVKEAKTKADLVVVSLHFGNEYDPSRSEEERLWIHRFAAFGVDVLIGTHPHVVKPMEWVDREDGSKMLVYGSLGNYVTGQGVLPEEQLQNLMAQYDLTGEEAKGLLILGGMASFTVVRDKDGSVRIAEAALLPVICHQAFGLYTGYLLGDYSQDMARIHRLEIDPSAMESLFQKLTQP